MTSCFSLYIVWGTVCVSLLSAVPQFSVSGPVGSTAILPCKLASDEPYVVWRTQSVTVFERFGEKSVHGEGYEGRVDVPLEELRKGICSLVLSDLRLNDTGVYTSEQTVKHQTTSVQKIIELSCVKLSVNEGKSLSENTGPTGDATMKNPDSLIMTFSLLSCLLFLYIL